MSGDRSSLAPKVNESGAQEARTSGNWLVLTDHTDKCLQHPALAAVHDRAHGGDQGQIVASSHLSCFRGVSDASEETEEGDMLDGADLIGRASHLFCQRHREQAGAQAVAEWLAGAEVGGERQ
jgi:hypothetical protein